MVFHEFAINFQILATMRTRWNHGNFVQDRAQPESIDIADVKTGWASELIQDLKKVQGMAIAATILGSPMMSIVCNTLNQRITCMLQWECYGPMLTTCVLLGLRFLIFRSFFCHDSPILRIIDEYENIFGQLRDTVGKECKIWVGAKCEISSTVVRFVTGELMCCETPQRLLDPHTRGILRISYGARDKNATALEEYEQELNTQQRGSPVVSKDSCRWMVIESKNL